MNEQIVEAQESLVNAGLLPLAGTNVDDSRRRYRRVLEHLRCDIAAQGLSSSLTSIDVSISPAVNCRIYTPRELVGTVPIVYFHGGGHVLGDLDTHSFHASMLAVDTQSVVVSVDYRKAPEHMWPAAVEDAIVACEWAIRERSMLGTGTSLEIALAGDSAGANLVACALNQLDSLPGRVAGALLAYPAIDFSIRGNYPSRVRHGSDGYLTIADMAWFGQTYAGKGAPVADPTLSPLHGDLAKLPPLVVATAGHDPLHDEGEAYVRKASENGNDVHWIDSADMPHGYYDFAAASSRAREVVRAGHQEFASRMRI